MKTTHNGIEIDWDFMFIEDTHDNNWAEWLVVGDGDDGKLYQGTCQADAKDPDGSNTGEVLNIEEI